MNTGFLFKQQRQARLDRVQAIDIVQPLLARIFGLAELKFEVADAGESAVRLAYLPLDQARQLRATILARAAGVVSEPGAARGTARGAGTCGAVRPAVAAHRFAAAERADRRDPAGGRPSVVTVPCSPRTSRCFLALDPRHPGHRRRVLEIVQQGL